MIASQKNRNFIQDLLPIEWVNSVDFPSAAGRLPMGGVGRGPGGASRPWRDIMRQFFFHRFASDKDGVVQIGAGIRFCARGQGQVPCGTEGFAPESGLFPPILSRQGQDAPPGRRILWYPFHPLDWEKSLYIICHSGGSRNPAVSRGSGPRCPPRT
jgi:hypothetical protein